MWAAVVIAALVLFRTSPADAETRILLIGVGAYSGLPVEYRLSAPARDLGRLTSSLVSSGVAATSIQTVSDARRGEGDRAEILSALSRLLDQTKAGDRVLLYYSGHGGQRPATHPERETDGLEEVWLAGDARIGPNGEPRGGVVADYEIVDVITRLRQQGADVWLVVDACYAGGVTRSAGSTDTRIKSVGRQSRAGDRRSNTNRYANQRADDDGLIGAHLQGQVISGSGSFTAFYAANAGSLALATASGSVFTNAFARALDSGRVSSFRDLMAAILSLDARLGADAPRPVFEGDLDRPVLDLTAGSARRFAIRRSGGAIMMAAGAEEGVEAGAAVSLEAADGRSLGLAVANRVTLGSTRLGGDVPQDAIAARLAPDKGRGQRPGDRILSAIETLGGAWATDTLDVSARLERPAFGACTEPVDPETPGPDALTISLANPPQLQNCDRLFLSVINRGAASMDVSLLYLAADGSVVGPSLHPVDEVRVRPGEQRTAAIRIVSESVVVVERLAVIAMPATSRFPLDLRYLATSAVRGSGEEDAGSDDRSRWWRAALEGDVTRGGAAAGSPGPTPVAITFPLRIVP